MKKLTILCHGVNLTDNQILKCKSIFKDIELLRLKSKVYGFKKEVEELALFRIYSKRMIEEISTRRVIKKPLLVEHKIWLNSWLIDQNTMVKDYFDLLELLIQG